MPFHSNLWFITDSWFSSNNSSHCLRWLACNLAEFTQANVKVQLLNNISTIETEHAKGHRIQLFLLVNYIDKGDHLIITTSNIKCIEVAKSLKQQVSLFYFAKTSDIYHLL